jgi:hypothetical protein
LECQAHLDVLYRFLQVARHVLSIARVTCFAVQRIHVVVRNHFFTPLCLSNQILLNQLP